MYSLTHLAESQACLPFFSSVREARSQGLFLPQISVDLASALGDFMELIIGLGVSESMASLVR